MNVALTNQEAEVNVEHNGGVSHKDMLHVVVLLRFILIPDEVSDESFNNVSIPTQLLQEITFTLKHTLLIGDRITLLTVKACLMFLQRNITLNSLVFTVCF